MTGLTGKAALVTGSTGEIGEAFARAFSAEGCNAVLNGLGDATAIEELCAGLERTLGIEIVFDPADLAGRLACDSQSASLS